METKLLWKNMDNWFVGSLDLSGLGNIFHFPKPRMAIAILGLLIGIGKTLNIKPVFLQ